ncbi:hypothetical protein HMPREF9436_02703, partial [Faecalibacterium cf. prausnitzii KLE1255]
QQYDTPEGANCLTVGKRHLSQREAAVEAIQKIGVCQIYDINKSIWDGQKKYKKEFNCRFCKLKETIVI